MKLDDKVPQMKHHLKYRLQHLISTKMPIKDSVEYEKKEPSYVLNKTEWQASGFNALDQFVDDSDHTFIIYNVIPIENGFALFIERFYDSETYHWLCLVNNNLVLNDKIVIAYDNAEGFTSTKTHSNQEKIIVNYYNIYEVPEHTFTTYKIVNLNFKKF